MSVVLPFLVANARRHGERELAEAAWAAYRHNPLPGDNSLTRWAAERLLGAESAAPSAPHQQGLLHLGKTGEASFV